MFKQSSWVYSNKDVRIEMLIYKYEARRCYVFSNRGVMYVQTEVLLYMFKPRCCYVCSNRDVVMYVQTKVIFMFKPRCNVCSNRCAVMYDQTEVLCMLKPRCCYVCSNVCSNRDVVIYARTNVGSDVYDRLICVDGAGQQEGAIFDGGHEPGGRLHLDRFRQIQPSGGDIIPEKVAAYVENRLQPPTIKSTSPLRRIAAYHCCGLRFKD